MSKKISFLLGSLLLFFLIHPGVQAEKISLRFSFKTNTINTGDIFSWIDSYNLLWEDWQNKQGGILEGQFNPPKYKANYEFELRFAVVAGFSLTLAGGSPLQSQTEGTVDLNNAGEEQTETQMIRNDITALPFKIGLSYQFRIPALTNLSINAGAGRLIIFANYDNFENYNLQAKFLGTDYNYWYEISGGYRSECLGFYANLTAEYEFSKFAAVVLGLEQRWAKMDGFKGSYSYKRNFELDEPDHDLSGKASLYFYELKPAGMGDYYTGLAGHIDRPLEGHIDRPVGGDIKNIRQGKLNLGGYSFIIGIRFIL